MSAFYEEIYQQTVHVSKYFTAEFLCSVFFFCLIQRLFHPDQNFSRIFKVYSNIKYMSIFGIKIVKFGKMFKVTKYCHRILDIIKGAV